MPWGVVPPASHEVPRVSWYSGYCRLIPAFPYTAFTLYGRISQIRSGGWSFAFCSPQPHSTRAVVWAFSGFARRYFRNRSFFLFLRLLRCFSSPGSPAAVMYWLRHIRAFPRIGCPIQIPVDQWVFAPPHRFSQLVTSFFGSQCQGILPVLFLFNQTVPPARRNFTGILAYIPSGRSACVSRFITAYYMSACFFFLIGLPISLFFIYI